jgi:adenosylhomocysteine nucleosidase
LRLGGRECLLVRSGMGLENAGEAARALLAAEKMEGIFTFGVAGAATEGLRIGDVVAVGSVTRLEEGRAGPWLPLAAFSGPALEAMAAALAARGARLARGAALTTRGSQVVPAELAGVENPVLEMETAAIARACAEGGAPLLALRGVSDSPSQPLPVDLGAVMDESSHLKIGQLLAALARNPGIVMKVGKMYQNLALAAENTAVAVIAALGQP